MSGIPVVRHLALAMLVVTVAGCDRIPDQVFVLQSPQSVELSVSADAATTTVGAPVVLRARRRTQGVWRQLPSRALQPGQCWMAAVPPAEEPEVAGNVHWNVTPAGAARFNTGFRSDRTRQVTFLAAGTFTLVATTGAWCEAGRQVAAEPLVVKVVAQ